MRWMFLLLVVLNLFYYVWHQQQAPLRAKEVAPTSSYQGARKDIAELDTPKLDNIAKALKAQGVPKKVIAQALQAA